MDDSERRIPAPHNLPYRMRLLVQSMARRFQQVLDPHDLTPLHWGVLSCLWQQDGLATVELANRLEQLPGTVIVALHSMEARGLIQRSNDESDRRIHRIRLTARGRELEAILIPETAALMEDMFSCLSDAEFQALSGQVDRLRAHIERDRESDLPLSA